MWGDTHCEPKSLSPLLSSPYHNWYPSDDTMSQQKAKNSLHCLFGYFTSSTEYMSKLEFAGQYFLSLTPTQSINNLLHILSTTSLPYGIRTKQINNVTCSCSDIQLSPVVFKKTVITCISAWLKTGERSSQVCKKLSMSTSSQSRRKLGHCKDFSCHYMGVSKIASL